MKLVGNNGIVKHCKRKVTSPISVAWLERENICIRKGAKIPHTIPTFIKSLEEYATKNKISTVPDIEAVMSDIAAETIIAEKPADIVKQMQKYEKVLSVYVDLNEQIRKNERCI